MTEDVFDERGGQPQGGRPVVDPNEDVFGEVEARTEDERLAVARELVEEAAMQDEAQRRAQGQDLTPEEAERRIHGVIGDLQSERSRRADAERERDTFREELSRLRGELETARQMVTTGAPMGRTAVTAGAPGGTPEMQLNDQDVLTVADYRRLAAADREALLNEAGPVFTEIGTRLRTVGASVEEIQKAQQLTETMAKHPDYNQVVGDYVRTFASDPDRDAILKDLSKLAPDTLYATARRQSGTPSAIAGGAAIPSETSGRAAEVLRRQSQGVRTAPITGSPPTAPTSIPPGRWDEAVRKGANDELTPSDLRRLGLV